MKVAIIGAPIDLGANRRGTDMGPSAIRYARLQEALQELGHEVVDWGNVQVPVPESREAGDEKLKYLPEIIEACKELAGSVARARSEGAFPLVLGGDHSLAIGSIAGLALAEREFGVIWLDAHGDFNTPESTPSGNIHGMSLAVAVGRGHAALVDCVRPGRKVTESAVALVGVRTLDQREREVLRESGLSVFTMKDIDRMGVGEVMSRALSVASAGGHRPVHVSLDLDVLDPMYAPGLGTPVPGGLTYREAHLAMELLADAGSIFSLEVVEVNPILDEGNRTAKLAVELITSALGKKII